MPLATMAARHVNNHDVKQNSSPTNTTPSAATTAATSANKTPFFFPTRLCRLLAFFHVPCYRWVKNYPNSFRLMLFFVCYLVFLSPLLVALFREYSYVIQNLTPASHPNLLLPIMSPGGPSFLLALSLWLGSLLVIYWLYRVVGSRLGIKLHDKTLAKHKDDLLRLLYFGMTMAAVGGISTRIEEGVVNTETGLTFVPLCMCYCVFFTMIFELVKDKNITLSVGMFDPGTSKLTYVVLFLAFITACFVIVSLFLSAFQVSDSFFAMYCGVSAVGLLLHGVMFGLSCFPLIAGRSYVHIHHWYWSVPLAHMCVFHTDVSMLAQAIFLAVHIHGVVCFGVEPLFYDTERRARHPSDFDWILKEHIHEKRYYDAYVPNEEDVILVLPPSTTHKHGNKLVGPGGAIIESNGEGDVESGSGKQARGSSLTRSVVTRNSSSSSEGGEGDALI